ncbi:MAG: hypothetical protein Q8O56_14460 [Solirubrobacteraceae bacterium]|nr:hypothetical protein [Solirubrobacteraceae bacterium]
MSQSRRIVAVMASLAVVVALPATAAAQSTKSSSPTSMAAQKAAVQKNVDKADKAVQHLKRHARLGSQRGVTRQLKIARSQSAAASQKARRMANRATTGNQNVIAAQALTLAGTQYDELIAAVTAIVDQVRGSAQTQVARAIAPSLAGKQRIIEVLNGLLPQVPAQAQPIIASIITVLSAGNATEITNLSSALEGGGLPVNISGIVAQCLEMATALLNDAFGMIQSLVPLLPAAAQGPLAMVLDMVTSTVGTIVPTVLTTVTGLIDTIIGSLPFVGSASASGGGMFGLGGLLGGLVGGGSQSLPGGIGGILDGLLGGLFGGGSGGGSSPVAGIGGIVNTVTGLISGLLGGLFGGGSVAPAT